MKVNILIIEDDESQQINIKDSIEAYCLRYSEREVVADYIFDDKDIGNKIFYNKYDCIVLDLYWENNPDGGRDLIDNIMNKKRIPLVVYSGNLSTIADMPETFGFLKYERTKEFFEVLDKIFEIKNTHIYDLLGYDGIIDDKISKVFWQDIDRTIKFIPKDFLNNGHNSVTRYLTTFAVGTLSVDENEEYQEFEFYIPYAQNGDPMIGNIYKIGDSYYLLVTPKCQLIQKKANKVSLINIKSGISKNASEKFKSSIYKLPKIAFLPEISVLDFNDLLSLPIEDVATLKPVCSVSEPFIKNIQSCFSQYYGRLGQPDFAKEVNNETIDCKSNI